MAIKPANAQKNAVDQNKPKHDPQKRNDKRVASAHAKKDANKSDRNVETKERKSIAKSQPKARKAQLAHASGESSNTNDTFELKQRGVDNGTSSDGIRPFSPESLSPENRTKADELVRNYTSGNIDSQTYGEEMSKLFGPQPNGITFQDMRNSIRSGDNVTDEDLNEVSKLNADFMSGKINRTTFNQGLEKFLGPVPSPADGDQRLKIWTPGNSSSTAPQVERFE
jgi:hypothetical protein